MLEEIFKNPKEKTDFIIAIVVVTLFTGAIVYGSFSDSDAQEDLSYATLVAIDEEPVIEQISEAISVDPIIDVEDVPSAKLTRDVVTIETWSPVVVSRHQPTSKLTEQNDDNVIAPIIDVEREDVDLAKEPEVKIASPTEGIIVPAIEEEESTAVDKENAEVLEEEPKAETTPKVTPSIRETGDCQIVVGAYSSKANRQRMLDQLLQANFVTFTYKQRGLYVASVKVSCEKSNQRAALEEIRKNFAKGAFIPRK